MIYFVSNTPILIAVLVIIAILLLIMLKFMREKRKKNRPKKQDLSLAQSEVSKEEDKMDS